MDDSGTKVISKKHTPLRRTASFPPNTILPKEMQIEKDLAPLEENPENEVPDFNEIEESLISEVALLVNETLPPNQPSSDKLIEGQVRKWISAGNYESRPYYMTLYQKLLSVYQGDSKEGQVLHQYQFPHGAEYAFSESYYNKLYIYENNGQNIILEIFDKELFNFIYQEWLSAKILRNFQKDPVEDNNTDYFDEKNYSFKFNSPSFREFGHFYNEKDITPFYYYPIVNGKPQIKNAVEFNHFFRPNRLMKSYEWECSEEIEEHMTNRNRKFIQWVPSRDWSRLFVLSTIPSKLYEGRCVDVYLEFYDFNNEKQIILGSPLRLNFLSQLLRPKWIQQVAFYKSEVKVEASFTGDTILISDLSQFLIIFLNPDWTIKDKRHFGINDAIIDSIQLSQSKLLVKSKGIYFEQQATFFFDKYTDSSKWYNASIYFEFRKTNLINIIQCGIHDILIYEKYVNIFSNINLQNQFDEIVVDDGILQLVKTQKFIQLDHQLIACLPLPQNDEAIPIKIIEISQSNLFMKKSDEIQLISPWNTLVSDSQFNLIKLKVNQYAVLIVTSASKNEQFYQYYKHEYLNNKYWLAYQKPLNDYKNLQQIPHLPLVTINGSQFINCDRYIKMYQLVQDHRVDDQLELDLQQNVTEILYQDQENINSQEVGVYHPHIMQHLCRFIEEKEDINHNYAQSFRNIHLIEISELQTSIIIKQGGENRGIIIFQPSFGKLKHIKFKQQIRYYTHKVIYRDDSYKVCFILSTDYAFYEMQMCFDLTGVTLAPLKLIINLTEEQNQQKQEQEQRISIITPGSKLAVEQREYELYLHDDFKVSFFIFGTQNCYFKHFSLNQQSQQQETIKIDVKDGKIQNMIPQLLSFIQRIARTQSTSLGKLFLDNFRSIIFQNTEGKIQNEANACLFAFQNKIILFEKGVNCLIIMDDSFSVIGNIILGSKFPPSIIRIASSIDDGALEYIDEMNSKFPIPIQGNLQDYKTYSTRLHNYGKNFNYPMPIQFGLLDGFIAHLDLKSQKLLFYKSNQDKKDGNIASRIEVIMRRESIIDDIINSKERKDIEERMNSIDINHLLSYNLNKRMNLITGTKKHAEKDHIYSILYKLLEIAEINELPMVIYNTSLDPTKYESILDILIQNKAIKLAQLIVSIAIKQDQIGYIYSRLGPYLSIFSSNELQFFIESQIFFFQIPVDCYEEYQVIKETLIRPYSDCQNYAEIEKNMSEVESYMQEIKENKPTIEKKDSISFEEGKEGDNLQASYKFANPKEHPVPIEYFAINLMNLITSKEQPLKENHRQVTGMLNQLAEKDATILEKESIKIIIDFKWNSYAWKFFSLQLGLFICFIIAFVIDIAAVSKNSHIFSSNNSNQTIPRIISTAIMILFAIYEIANFVINMKNYFASFWNVNDMLLIFVYAVYFTMTFVQPEQQYALKSLQLVIVILSFIKFSFLIRIWTRVSFLVRMLIVVFKELLIFLFFFLLVIGGLTVMAQIILKESGDEYEGIKLAAYFVIVLRQSIGDYDTSSIIEGTNDFKILAWLLWLLILIIGNIVFMNFIIAVVSESYESCMEKKVQLIYRAKLEMITECEDLMPQSLFANKNWFPRFIIIRREQGSGAGGDNPDEWCGFVKQMKRHLEHETSKLNEILIQNINRSTESTKKQIKAGQEEAKSVTSEMQTSQEVVKKDIAELKTGQEELKKETAEVRKETAQVKVQMNEIKLILSAVFKDQIAAIKTQEVQANQNKAI